MHPKMIPVLSSNIEGYVYISSTETLLVTFKQGGATYAYENVSRDVVVGLANAKSFGKYVQSVLVKQPDIHPFAQLDSATLDELLNESTVAPAYAASATKKQKRTIDWLKVVARNPFMRNAF